ncbi:PREDICTED: transmembrane protein 156 [Chrysochloris asiatica]|uniref:Transmembrane protein 156 n=1 Tax=Chrysochloris asiatica TaxID=185453 RepID=A0A9B0TYY5_CHRAS|nr:PREDICTED: transmembrane protein 156 [Chrysochloris asiatica]
MTKTAFLKLFVAIVIAIILILPDYFKTPEENVLELSCLEVCLQHNFSYSLSSLNFSFKTFLQLVRETQITKGIFLNHSNFQNFTRICQDIMSEFKICSSCLICGSKGNMDFISQEQASKVLIRRGSMNVKASDFHLLCQHFNFTVALMDYRLEGYNSTCNLNILTRKPEIVVEDPPGEKSLNHSCRFIEGPNNCIHVSLNQEMDVKNFTCSMKIIWYVLVLLVFISLIIFIIHKILEGHRRVQEWQSHKHSPTAVLLRESDSEKLRVLSLRVISGKRATYIGKGCGTPCSEFLKDIKAGIPVGSMFTAEKENVTIDLKVEHVSTNCCDKNLCNGVAWWECKVSCGFLQLFLFVPVVFGWNRSGDSPPPVLDHL